MITAARVLSVQDLDGLTISQVRVKRRAGWELTDDAKDVYNAARDELGDFIGRFVEIMSAAMEELNGGPFSEIFLEELDMSLTQFIVPVAFMYEDETPIRVPKSGKFVRPPHFTEVGDNKELMDALTKPFIDFTVAKFEAGGEGFLETLPTHFNRGYMDVMRVKETMNFKLLDYSEL